MSSSVSPCPSLSFHLFSSPLSFSFVSCISLCYPCSRCLFLAAVDTLAYLIFLPSLFLSGLFLFILNLLQTSDVSPLSRSLCFFFTSVNDPGISPSHFSRGLYCDHARELRRELQPRRVRGSYGIPCSLPRSSLGLRAGVPATKQISNKWNGCAKPRRFNYWCLVTAHQEWPQPRFIRVAVFFPFLSVLLSCFLGEHYC